MSRFLLGLALLCAALPASSEVVPGETPSLHAAGSVLARGGDLAFDGALTSRVSPVDARGLTTPDPCATGSCDLRVGPGPRPDVSEPRSPFQREEPTAGPGSQSGFNWRSPWVTAGAGALALGLVGFWLGGLWGALIGAAIGGLAGWFGPRMMGWGS